MTLIQQIYDKCGLEDAETFMRRKHADNLQTAGMFAAANSLDVVCDQTSHGMLYRQIGATKWMAAHAAMVVLHRSPVLIVSRSFAHGQEIVKDIRNMCDTMTGLLLTVYPDKLIQCTDHSGFTSSNKPHKGSPFHDDQWKERAVRRIQGPFAMTREIRYEHGKYVAYAEDDEQLMTIAPDGLMDFMTKWPGVVAVGWRFDGLTAAPYGTMPTIRGALGAGVSPTKNMAWHEGRRKTKPSNFASSFIPWK